MYLIFCYFILSARVSIFLATTVYYSVITLPIFAKLNRLSFSYFLTYCESVFLQANGVNDLSPNQNDVPLML